MSSSTRKYQSDLTPHHLCYCIVSTQVKLWDKHLVNVRSKFPEKSSNLLASFVHSFLCPYLIQCLHLSLSSWFLANKSIPQFSVQIVLFFWQSLERGSGNIYDDVCLLVSLHFYEMRMPGMEKYQYIAGRKG